MNFMRQFFAILRLNLSGAGQRLGSLLTIVIGVTCAVGVLVSMLDNGQAGLAIAAGGLVVALFLLLARRRQRVRVAAGAMPQPAR